MNLSVGEKIRDLRIAKNVTQSKLAESVSVSASAVSSYEISARLPSYDVLTKIASFFNVTTDYLLGLGAKDVIDVTGLDGRQRNIIGEIVSDYRAFNALKRQ